MSVSKQSQWGVGPAVLAAGYFLLASTSAAAQTIERISVGAGGVEADGRSYMPRLSRDGRFAVFLSNATNLVANDAGGADTDVFVRDLVDGVNELVSVAPASSNAFVWAVRAAISADGRYVAFAGNGFDAGDTDATPDVFVRDRASATTLWATPWNDGAPITHFDLEGVSPILAFGYGSDSVRVLDLIGGASWSWSGASDPEHGYSGPVVARGGRYVLLSHYFVTQPDNTYVFELLVLDTVAGTSSVVVTNGDDMGPVDISSDGRIALFEVFSAHGLSGAAHLFSLDIQTGAVQRMDVSKSGLPGNESYRDAALSGEGRYVAYTSRARNLVDGDEDWIIDLFVRETAGGGNARASTGLGGAPAWGDANLVDISFTGGLMIFDSDASNLVPGDTNAASDVFLRTGAFPHYADLDGDRFGAGAALPQLLPPPAGLVLADGDCDDGNPLLSPRAGELPCTGIDENCDGAIDETGLGQPICIWNTSTVGCAPRLEVSGCASASASSGLLVHTSGLEGQRNAMLFYGLVETVLPYSNWSWLCVAAPRQRMDVLDSGGTGGTCDGSFDVDLLAWIAAHPSAVGTPLTAGQQLVLQAWFRDPPAAHGANLSRGWKVTLLP